MCYLDDEEVMEFLRKAVQKGLQKRVKGKSGLLIIKENVRRREILVDNTDGSITRTSG